MSAELQALYRETILDHSRRPRGAGLREPYAAEVHQVNPVCGDEVTVRLSLADDGRRVADVSHDSRGCSISVASTSVMAAALAGREVADALAAYEAFHALVTSAAGAGRTSTGVPAGGAGTAEGGGSEAATALEKLVTDDDDPLADAQAFAGVARYPARVKCALLGWTALRTALVESPAAT